LVKKYETFKEGKSFYSVKDRGGGRLKTMVSEANKKKLNGVQLERVRA